ncbi:hypothetical protein HAP48_0027290 [Bradyrhizobium septentrionale]|uniref:Uncharacterized protein n=1 Tax=Bradyrhizobium septentrionale TaxID=1404411 RepID=A0A974A0F6_9BRAD|nr:MULTISPECIES: hypothetical protein [Bradyrhizobium]MCK7667873.1 hypothetical protein [Bradyrhizobium sp. 2S1]UGY12360.1 hypothetical protein HAP48_0027290 [Bradyrhizobium septentrionale]UGY25530.1 hypothetical protein HU675_0000900 [Bradyrhizobium septentrionale]
MSIDFTLAELRSRLDRLDPGAVLRISEHDYERLFGINEVAAAKVAQFAGTNRCVSIPGADAVYFRRWSTDEYETNESTELA